MQPSGLWPASVSRSPSILQRRLGLLEVWRRASPKCPRCGGGGLGGRGAIVAEHEHEGAGKVVGQEAAAVLFPDREQEEQQQEEQEQQLQGERHAAHLPAESAEPSPLRRLQNQSGRHEWARGWGLRARHRRGGKRKAPLRRHEEPHWLQVDSPTAPSLGFPICEVGLTSTLPETNISSFLRPLKAREEEGKAVTGFVRCHINLCLVYENPGCESEEGHATSLNFRFLIYK